MKSQKVLIAVVCLMVIGVTAGVFFPRGKPGNRGNSGDPDAQLYADRASNVFACLKTGDCDGAMRDFSRDLKEAMVDGKFAEQWSNGTIARGSMQSYAITHAEDDYQSRSVVCRVYVTCRFEKTTLYGIVAFGPQKEICDFTLWGEPQR